MKVPADVLLQILLEPIIYLYFYIHRFGMSGIVPTNYGFWEFRECICECKPKTKGHIYVPETKQAYVRKFCLILINI